MKIKIKVTGPMECGKTHTLHQLQNLLGNSGWKFIRHDYEKNTLTAEKANFARKAGYK